MEGCSIFFDKFWIRGKTSFESILPCHENMVPVFGCISCPADFFPSRLQSAFSWGWYGCKCLSFTQNVLCNTIKKHWAILFSMQGKNRSLSKTTFVILLFHRFPLRFCAVTLRAYNAGRKDPILDIKTTFDHIPFTINKSARPKSERILFSKMVEKKLRIIYEISIIWLNFF